jgi:hypothetical protein
MLSPKDTRLAPSGTTRGVNAPVVVVEVLINGDVVVEEVVDVDVDVDVDVITAAVVVLEVVVEVLLPPATVVVVDVVVLETETQLPQDK